MINASENEWNRFRRLREDLSACPPSEVPTTIDRLRREGESVFVISMLEAQYGQAQQPELQPGRRLASRYTIKEKIGKGGMGIVYRAVQELTQQEVALKVIDPARVSSFLMKRFREEIRALGKLQHDHIVRVFDADYDRSDPLQPDLLFYAMQLVQGLPLMRWVDKSHPTVEARLECFIQICEGVDYAHRHGVVHRDLKPDNILVDAGGRAAILDFGLAQLMDLAFEPPEGPLTSENRTLLQVSGTPVFMSPERWEGHPGGVPADIFALGVILHEMLTGAGPWNVAPNASPSDLRRAICRFSPDQLQEHAALTRPLARLVGSMLAVEPSERPQSAAAVANALRMIVARRRLKRRIRRTAPIWAGIAVVLGVASATQSYSAWLKRQKRESEQRLVQASRLVRQPSQLDTLVQVIKLLPAKPKLRHSQDEWRDLVLEAMCTWNLNTLQAVPLPIGFEPKAGNPQGTCFFGRSTAGWWEVIERRGGAWASTRFPVQGDFLRARINPRQTQLAALMPAGGLLVSWWNQNQHTNLLTTAQADTQFEFSPDGRYLACSVANSGPQGVGSEGLPVVRVFDTGTWKEVAFLFKPGDQPEPGTVIYVHSRPVAGLAFSPGGKHLAAWSRESSYLLIWDWSKEQLVHFAAHPDRIAAAAWRPDPESAELATIQANGLIRVWKLPSASKAAAYLTPGESIEWGRTADNFQGQLAWAPGGEALAAIEEVSQTMEIFSTDTATASFRVTLRNPASGGMRWLSRGLVRSGEGRHEWIPFDSDPPVRRILRIPNFGPNHLAFNPEGTVVAAADSTRIVLASTATGTTLVSSNMPLSGPIAFDETTGDLWAYSKTDGPIHWTVSPSRGGLVYVPGTKAVGQSSVGQLAASGGHLVFSRGTNIFVVKKNSAFAFDRASPDIAVDAPPEQLAIRANGLQVAAIWRNPWRAALWCQQEGDGWVPKLTITNAPVLANLPEWNCDGPLTIRPSQQRTAEEKSLKSGPSHLGIQTLLLAAAQVPMVAWFRNPAEGVHLDYLGRESCIHVATLPFDPPSGLHTAIALSPDGMRLAAVSSKGEIHLWDLRRAFRKLAELQLGIDEISIEKLAQGERSATTSPKMPGSGQLAPQADE